MEDGENTNREDAMTKKTFALLAAATVLWTPWLCPSAWGDPWHRHRWAPHGYSRCDPPAWTPYSSRMYGHGGGTVGLGWDRELVGSLVGGAAGGLIGTHIGKGSGRTAAIIGGTVVGVLVGGGIGRSMDQVDRLWMHQTLEYAPSRQATTWRNPDSGAVYEATPMATYQSANGRYCREFTTTALVGGTRQEVYGTACRQPDGSWEIVR